jgi:hypothetical protein
MRCRKFEAAMMQSPGQSGQHNAGNRLRPIKNREHSQANQGFVMSLQRVIAVLPRPFAALGRRCTGL